MIKIMDVSANETIESVKEYYGKQLKTTEDLQTPACTTPALKMPKYFRDILAHIHDEVVSKYYGCGLIVPACLEGMKVLDLGSGSGRDCYALSKLVGKNGFVTGIDMTDEQLEVANRHVEYHTKLFGYEKANTKFVKGYIENLKDAGIEDNSVDIIVSNCVINLCKDKKKVLSEAFRVLKDGGELYFSDVYVDRELSEEIRSHELLWGECVSGALYWKQLFDLAQEIGFETPRTVSLSSFDIAKPDLKKVVGDTKFASVIYRLFKLPANVDRSSSQVTYNGSVTENEDELKFDRHYLFKNGELTTVDGDTSAILKCSRFKDDLMFKKAPCCAKTTQIIAENPFELLASSDDSVITASSCCDNSKECC